MLNATRGENGFASNRKVRDVEMEVKAAVMDGPRRIRIASFPKPKVEEKASLLKVESTAICGTDLHRYL